MAVLPERQKHAIGSALVGAGIERYTDTNIHTDQGTFSPMKQGTRPNTPTPTYTHTHAHTRLHTTHIQGGPLVAVGLAPMAALPERQKHGVGSALVRAGIERCREMGVDAVFVLGHPEFYPKCVCACVCVCVCVCVHVRVCVGVCVCVSE